MSEPIRITVDRHPSQLIGEPQLVDLFDAYGGLIKQGVTVIMEHQPTVLRCTHDPDQRGKTWLSSTPFHRKSPTA